MLTLPPIAPSTAWHSSLRLPHDHCVRIDDNHYSVHPSAVGHRVEISAGLRKVVVTCQGRVVAEHDRCGVGHQSITVDEHAYPADRLREQARRTVYARSPNPSGNEY